MPQHVIFAFRFQNELARVFFWGQNELAQFSSEGGFELALFFFWADFGFLLGPFRASSLSWLYLPGPIGVQHGKVAGGGKITSWYQG